MICEGSTCSAALPESHTGFVAPESGRSSVDPHKPDCVSPKVVGTTEPFETKHELGNNKGPTNQSAPVSDTVGDGGNYSPNSQNPNGNDAFKDRGNGTSDVSLSADLPKADTANIVQRSPAIPSPKVSFLTFLLLMFILNYTCVFDPLYCLIYVFNWGNGDTFYRYILVALLICPDIINISMF